MRFTTLSSSGGILPAFVLLLGLEAAGCSGPSTLTGPAPGATIQGNVSSSGSSVSATALSATSIRVTVVGTALSTTTDASGRFVLTGVPSGTVTLHFEGPGVDATLQISGLSAGQVLTITVQASGSHATLVGSGSGHEVEFHGTIDSVTPPASLVVAGRTVNTSPSTQIRNGGLTATFADLKPGQRVEVEGTTQADDSVLASKIKIEDDQEDDDEFEFKGKIESLAAPSLVVAGRTVVTTPSTRIESKGKTIPFSDLKVDQVVEVEGRLQTDGSILAKKVKLEDDGDDHDDDHDDEDDDEDDD